jgi:peptidoglycan/LPS O-acetylase OafA/YrhL
MRYVPALDGLRALAVMLVFLFHTSHVRGGWVGVDVFFVLSGYLITSILLTEHDRTGAISLRRFYIRRACRLLPAVIVIICVAVALAVYFQNKMHDTVIDAVAALCYIIDYRYALMLPDAVSVHATALLHLWSLSVEEQFYFLWPLFLIASLSMWNRRTVFRATVGLIIVVAAWRILLFATGSDPSSRLYFAFDTRADELLIGCALALWRSDVLAARFLMPLWPVAALLLAVVVLKIDRASPLVPVGYPLLGASVACLIVVVTGNERSFLRRMLSLWPVVALGRISYGFYIWHFLIIIELQNHLVVHRTVLVFSLTLIAAVASYWLIERPFLRLKFAHPRSVSLPPSSGAVSNSPNGLAVLPIRREGTE